MPCGPVLPSSSTCSVSSPSLYICPLSVLSCFSLPFLCVSVFLYLPPSLSSHLSICDTHARAHTQRSYTCQHTRFSTSSHPATPRTSLAGELDCHAPEGHSPQGWGRRTGQHMPGASCSSLQPTPHPYNTQCWLCRGYRPWPLTRAPCRSSHLEQMPNIRARETHGPRPPCLCPLRYPGIWAHSPRPPFNTQHPSLPASAHTHTPHSGSFLSPHIWHKSAPPPARPCLVVPRA